MRRILGLVVVVLMAAACRGTSIAASPPSGGLVIRESPKPFTAVRAGPVSAIVPDHWRPMRIADHTGSTAEEGFVAAPRPERWYASRNAVEGMAAMWVDGAEVGVPSDYYYLAATGPALGALTDPSGCTATRHTVFVNHRPVFADGRAGSPGDYVARGSGICGSGRGVMRWGYFVAAPGYGSVRAVGIPDSALYVVVAVVPDSHHASARVHRLLENTEFGGTSVSEMIAAVRA